jgi:cholesterol transport system auxiliary component
VKRALAPSTVLLAMGAAALLAACGGASNSPPAPRSYDLGIAPASAKLPPLYLTAVRATAPYDGTGMLYRLAWRDGAEVAAFANSRWAAAPPELVRKRLLRALPATGNPPCGLALELHEFTQVFSSKEASEARLEMRAQLFGPGGARLASRSVSVTEPNAGADAPSGAAALGRATDRALAELGAWISAQPSCKS